MKRILILWIGFCLLAVSFSQAPEIEWAFVQGGMFMMGCTPEQGSDCRENELPAHHVTVSDFDIGKYEVTQAQWKAVMGSNPSSFKGDNLPVEGWGELLDI